MMSFAVVTCLGGALISLALFSRCLSRRRVVASRIFAFCGVMLAATAMIVGLMVGLTALAGLSRDGLILALMIFGVGLPGATAYGLSRPSDLHRPLR
jgi:hypothetical protein